MATSRSKPPQPPTSTVRRGGPDRGLRNLPRDLEDLASGESDRVQRPPRSPGRITDERLGGLIPGVANREARVVLDRRVEKMRKRLKDGDDKGLALLLFEARLMGLWRAGRIVDFAALCQDLVGMDPERARELTRETATSLGLENPDLTDAAIAVWMRIETRLAELVPEARVGIAGEAGVPQLNLVVPMAKASEAIEAFAAVGRSLGNLRKLL